MTLSRALTVIFILLLLHSVVAVSTGWKHNIMDQHGFRQTQTAMTIDYMVKGGPWISYETPVLGPPWAIPIEFPLYQWVAALTVFLLHIPVDQAGRLVSILFYYASLVPIHFLLRRVGLSMEQRLPFLILTVASPIYIFWSRTVMIESCALFLSLVYLAAAAEYLDKPKTSLAVLTLASGALAAMVKITTFFGFAVCAGFFLLSNRLFRPNEARESTRTHLIFAGCAGIGPFLGGYGWSLFAEAQRELNPLADFLSLHALQGRNFGTINLRFSPEMWRVMWSRSVTDILGSNLLILPILVCLPLIRRERTLSLLSVAAFLIVELTFSYLHFESNYYPYANGLFLIAALGFCIAGLIGLQGHARVSGLILLGLSIGLALYQYHVSFHQAQAIEDISVQGIAKAIQQNSKPEDVVMVYGMDWSSELPYSSHRRGIMVRDNTGAANPMLQKSLANLGSNRIGAIAFCRAARALSAEIEGSTCLYGFEESPKYEDNICALYLPSAHPKPADSCSLRLINNPVLGYLDVPVAGARIGNSLDVGGWALSQVGIREVTIYLDGRPVGAAKLGVHRPDVQKVHPQFRDSLTAGFQATIDLGRVDAGSHVIAVEVEANDGGRRDLTNIPITVGR
jgi:hypothetical protein